jgi:hypothetical protein
MSDETVKELRAQKRILERRIRAIVVKKQTDTKKRASANRRKRLASTLKNYGGKAVFIERFGQGGVIDETLNAPSTRCSYTYSVSCYQMECKMLNVPPTTFKCQCMFTGKYSFNGKNVCGVHHKMLLSDEARAKNRWS